MKTFHTLIATLLSITLMTFISGCGGGGGSSTAIATTPASTPTTQTGTIALSITDAPIDDANVKGVYVTFEALRYQYADSDDNWEDVDLNEPRTINLLDLQNGNTTLLHKVDLPAGEISHVRFVLDLTKCYIIFKDDEKTSLELEVPSGEQTGYKAIGGFTIPANQITNITADFDVRKSVTATGNGRYKLRPTIKIIDNVEVGEINGTMTLDVDTDTSKVIVYTYEYADEEGSWSDSEEDEFANAASSTDATDGTYTLPWLTTGYYDLVVVETDTEGVFQTTLGVITRVSVIANETTTINIDENSF